MHIRVRFSYIFSPFLVSKQLHFFSFFPQFFCIIFFVFVFLQPPRRRKTLWDFLLDEMRLIATDYNEERKLARHLLRGVANRTRLARRELCEVKHVPHMVAIGSKVVP